MYKIEKNILIMVAVFLIIGDVECHLHQHYHTTCVQEHQLIVIPQQQINHRLLQNSTPHGLRMLGHYYQTSSSPNYTSTIKNMFAIAAYYFQNALFVTSITQNNTIYNSSNTCGVTVTTPYTTTGYDINVYDMVVFITTNSQSGNGVIAVAAPCMLVRWPTYGFIRFNLAYLTIISNNSKAATFHSNVYVAMHELVHVLGLNTQLYSNFFESYSSQTLRATVRTAVPSNSSKTMIATPTVMAYVQSYFGCNDTTVGGLLQDQGGSGTNGVHWQRSIYLDELMTGSNWLGGLKISELTLSLLKDTGFYYSVDTTLSEKFLFGKNQGCSFALGTSNSLTQYCNISVTGNKCDYYQAYAGRCLSDSYSNSKGYITSYSNTVCTFPESKTQAAANNVYSSGSHCFIGNYGFGNQVNCFAAQCINNDTQVSVTVSGSSATCSNSTVSVSLAGGTVYCPTSISRFCLRKPCTNWCSMSGLCIKGTCLSPNLNSTAFNTSLFSNGLKLLVGLLLVIVFILQ